MSQWQITANEYLERLELDIKEFESKLQLPQVGEVANIVPLREITRVESIVPISPDLILYLIRRIKTLDGQMPFTNSTIERVVVNPNQPKIGQKYVYRENYQQLLESLSGIFHPLMGEWGSLGSLWAYFVFGLNKNGQYSMACYMPPIIEVHNSKPLIMDGIHRNYIARQTGLTINALLVKNVEIPFPCSPRNWNEIQVIPLTDKPKSLEDRYFELRKGLFRDLKYLGIDG